MFGVWGRAWPGSHVFSAGVLLNIVSLRLAIHSGRGGRGGAGGSAEGQY